MTRFALVFLLVGSAAAAPGGEADENLPEAPQPPEDARAPAPYWVHGTLDGATAKLVVRYRVRAVGPSNANSFELAVPDGGVVTGALVAGEGITRRLELDPTEKADDRVGKVLDGKAGPRRGWAIELVPSNRMLGGVTAVIAAPRATGFTIDLEIDAPTCFHRDQRMVAFDPGWRRSIDRRLKIVADGCRPPPAEGWEAEEHPLRAWLAWPAPTRETGPQIATRSERLDVAHGSFAHLEVALGTQLAQVPADLHTVFVVDISRSVAASELETEAAIIKSYLAHAPATQVQIVLYARKPRALFPAWTTASAASATIGRELAAVIEQNGSNVDAGLVEAARWLAPIAGTRRVVLFSDDRLADRVAGLQPEVLRAVLPAHTLVHVVAVDHAHTIRGAAWNGVPPAEQPTVMRDDEVAFAKLALASEGFAAHARTDDGRADALVLVRPIALEQVSIAGGTWGQGDAPQLAHACPHERADGEFRKLDLAEGDSCEWFGEGTGELGEITLHGLLWNHRVERRLAPDPGGQLGLARTLVGFGTGRDGEADKEVDVVARAVDRAWSLVATWGGPDGYGDMTGSSEISGAYCGCDGPSTFGTSGFGSALDITSRSSLDEQLSHAIAACHAGAKVTIDLELTMHEIVDVKVAAPTAALRDCVTEAVWTAQVMLAKPLAHATAHVVI